MFTKPCHNNRKKLSVAVLHSVANLYTHMQIIKQGRLLRSVLTVKPSSNNLFNQWLANGLFPTACHHTNERKALSPEGHAEKLMKRPRTHNMQASSRKGEAHRQKQVI